MLVLRVPIGVCSFIHSCYMSFFRCLIGGTAAAVVTLAFFGVCVWWSGKVGDRDAGSTHARTHARENNE